MHIGIGKARHVQTCRPHTCEYLLRLEMAHLEDKGVFIEGLLCARCSMAEKQIRHKICLQELYYISKYEEINIW